MVSFMARVKEKDSESRTRILEAAIDEFAEHGLNGARVDRIARLAGVNKAMIYYHFDSKEGLYRSILDTKIDEISSFLRQKIDTDEELASILLGLSRLYNLTVARDPKLMAIFLHEMAGGAKHLKKSLSEMMQHRGIPAMMVRRLEAGIQAGTYRDLDAAQVIISFIGMNFFYVLMAPLINQVWEIQDEEAFRQKRPEEVVRLFMRGIEKK